MIALKNLVKEEAGKSRYEEASFFIMSLTVELSVKELDAL
jgi:hypothetical protein